MSRIGIVVGMQAEAEQISAAWRKHSQINEPFLVVSAADPRRAYEGAKALVIEGAEALLSLGLAGGLVPTLETGDVVLASAIVMPGGRRLETDPSWLNALAMALKDRPRTTIGAVAGQDKAIATRAEKAALRLRTGAIAVDMESHGVAAAAREAGTPFMALRVVLDPASSTIPRSALAGLGPKGETRGGAVLARLLIRPWEIPALCALGIANKRALDVLGRLAADLAPGFVFRV